MIRDIREEEIKEFVQLIRKSYQTVADAFGLTKENAPRFAAFSANEESLTKQLSEGHSRMFGCFSEDGPVGYGSLFFFGGNTAELKELCVLPAFRHRGYGKELLAYASEKAVESGATLLRLGYVAEDLALQTWFEGKGFEQSGAHKFDFLPFTLGFMMKRLVEPKGWEESQTGLYRYETHLHTVEGSACGMTPGREYPAVFQARGYDGIFITDHFFHGNTRPSRDLPWPEYVEAYMKGYEEAKKAGDEIGFKVFFGIEENFEGDEFLLYGIDKEFLLAHPEIPHWTREDMIKAVHEAGGAVMQAHPFRDRDYIRKIHLYAEDIEGIEGINTANTANDNLAALCYADHFDLMIQAGSDTHSKWNIDEKNGGILYSEPIVSEQDYANRLLKHQKPIVFFPEELFSEMPGIKIKLPVEIRRNGVWEDLDPETVKDWIHEAGAAWGTEEHQPEGIAHKIAERRMKAEGGK